ncbi:hypothetical protein ACJ41O_003782 [Fusarium nematophilum]
MANQEPQEESYWPTIRQHIQNNVSATPSTKPPIKPQCPICLEKVSVPTFPEPQPSSDSTRCQVLACGHILCKACVECTSKCPLCRLSLQCTSCGAKAQFADVPSANSSPSDVNEMSPTVPEGGTYEPRCPRCASRDAVLEDILKGKWPAGSETLEPGFLEFVYHAADSLEEADKPVTKRSILMAFASIIDEEGAKLLRAREAHIQRHEEKHRQQNPWFPRRGGQDREQHPAARVPPSRPVATPVVRAPQPQRPPAQVQQEYGNIWDYMESPAFPFAAVPGAAAGPGHIQMQFGVQFPRLPPQGAGRGASHSSGQPSRHPPSSSEPSSGQSTNRLSRDEAPF